MLTEVFVQDFESHTDHHYEHTRLDNTEVPMTVGNKNFRLNADGIPRYDIVSIDKVGNRVLVVQEEPGTQDVAPKVVTVRAVRDRNTVWGRLF